MSYFADRLNLLNPEAKREVAEFLKDNFNMVYGDGVDRTFLVRSGEEIIATASRDGNVIKYLGVKAAYRGENIAGVLIAALLEDLFQAGIYHCFIFTTPSNQALIESLGFREIIATPYSVLLEFGNVSIHSYMDQLKALVGGAAGQRGAIVMNLNPMTLGHLHLIETALKSVDELLIFIVEADRSVYPFAARYRIAAEELSRYGQIKVLPGGPYIISPATFPTYFLKQADDDLKAYTLTDAGIFGRYFAKALDITKRFVGEEPLDPLTNEYNRVLRSTLEPYGVELIVIPRLERAQQVISASRVRRFLAQGDVEKALELVPNTTKKFILSKEGQGITQVLKTNLDSSN